MMLTVRLPIADPLSINVRNAASQSEPMTLIIRSAGTPIAKIALTVHGIMQRIGRIIRMAKNFENGVSPRMMSAVNGVRSAEQKRASVAFGVERPTR